MIKEHEINFQYRMNVVDGVIAIQVVSWLSNVVHLIELISLNVVVVMQLCI